MGAHHGREADSPTWWCPRTEPDRPVLWWMSWGLRGVRAATMGAGTGLLAVARGARVALLGLSVTVSLVVIGLVLITVVNRG